MERKTGIYIHIPFCVRKCNYCAFLSFDAEGSPRKEYTDALIREIKMRSELIGRERQIDTVYFGGGTPSVLDISQMRDIMYAIRTSFNIKEDAEITIEANPGTLGAKDGVTLAKLQAYKFMGFNRLSMGVQSMDNNRLHYMGRIHTAGNVIRDMKLIRQKGFDNVNLDLMFSIPGETTSQALDDLAKIMELGPEHISCYSLQIEEGTPFGEMAADGRLTEVPDEEDRRTYHEICRVLREAGYEHYEISNFARPGYRSRHNSLYWDMSDYIGMGLGASGFVDGVRYRNVADLKEYIGFFGKGGTTNNDKHKDADPAAGGQANARIPLDEEHVNTDFDNVSEAVFTGLRRKEGITYEETGCTEEEFWNIFAEAREEAEDFSRRGLLIIDSQGLRLTEKGIDISNSIMACFV